MVTPPWECMNEGERSGSYQQLLRLLLEEIWGQSDWPQRIGVSESICDLAISFNNLVFLSLFDWHCRSLIDKSSQKKNNGLLNYFSNKCSHVTSQVGHIVKTKWQDHFLNLGTVFLTAVNSRKLNKAHCSPPLVDEDNSMVFTTHSVPFPATRDLRSLVAGNGTSWETKTISFSSHQWR